MSIMVEEAFNTRDCYSDVAFKDVYYRCLYFTIDIASIA